jgi:hypothetical protein
MEVIQPLVVETNKYYKYNHYLGILNNDDRCSRLNHMILQEKQAFLAIIIVSTW